MLRNNSGESSDWAYLIVIVVVIGVLDWAHGAIWGEREGSVKTDDCRTRIAVKEDSSDTWFRRFTCIYQKDEHGNLLRGICESVETKNAACDTAYFYEKKADPGICPKSAPYFGIDGRCQPYPHDQP